MVLLLLVVLVILGDPSVGELTLLRLRNTLAAAKWLNVVILCSHSCPKVVMFLTGIPVEPGGPVSPCEPYHEITYVDEMCVSFHPSLLTGSPFSPSTPGFPAAPGAPYTHSRHIDSFCEGIYT